MRNKGGWATTALCLSTFASAVNTSGWREGRMARSVMPEGCPFVIAAGRLSEERAATPNPVRVLNWPRIREDGVTPRGLGREQGGQPCFGTRYNHCDVYVPKTMTGDPATARSIFEQLIPTLDGMWPECGDRTVEIQFEGRPITLLLYFAFSHILVGVLPDKRAKRRTPPAADI